TEFTRERILDAVAKLIACDDLALMFADKNTFHNCLVVMRPKTRSAELPSINDVRGYLRNTFVNQIEQL
ncbi:hypothetical protein JOM56_001309, partial [Amanita muscaria]